MSFNDGGPAFPIHLIDSDIDSELIWKNGMSLREYYAGIALRALIPHESFAEQTIPELVNSAFLYADEMVRQSEIQVERS